MPTVFGDNFLYHMWGLILSLLHTKFLFYLLICCISFVPERKYGDKHEWITLDGKLGTVGITSYAQVI